MYQEMLKPFNPKCDKDFVDYNYLVDDILQISPPYQQGMVYKPTQSENNRAQIDPKGLQTAPIPSVTSTKNQAILQAMVGVAQGEDPASMVPQMNPTLSFSELPAMDKRQPSIPFGSLNPTNNLDFLKQDSFLGGLGSLQMDQNKSPDKKISKPTPIKSSDMAFKKQISGMSEVLAGGEGGPSAFSFLQSLGKQESSMLQASGHL